jgi:hypothetical protein
MLEFFIVNSTISKCIYVRSSFEGFITTNLIVYSESMLIFSFMSYSTFYLVEIVGSATFSRSCPSAFMYAHWAEAWRVWCPRWRLAVSGERQNAIHRRH